MFESQSITWLPALRETAASIKKADFGTFGFHLCPFLLNLSWFTTGADYNHSESVTHRAAAYCRVEKSPFFNFPRMFGSGSS